MDTIRRDHRAGRAADTGSAVLLAAARRWAVERPDEVAVTAPDGSVTWSEVWAHIAAVVSVLRRRDAGRGTSVAVATGRSRHAFTGLLAVWAAGATAVLVDERQPAAQLSLVMRDSDVRLLAVPQLDPGWLPFRVPVLPIDTLAAGTDAEVTAAEVAPDDLAYVIYTSGTTGQPKGVEVPQRALATFLHAISTLGLPPGGLGINAVSPAFDGWLWCALLALVHGQGMAIVDVGAESSAGLADQLEALAPRTVSLTPSLLAACDSDLPSAEIVVAAGERCPPWLAERFAPGRRMLNVYGPTETTIAATWADSATGHDVRDIGVPLPGYHVHVLDEDGRSVAPGTTGELHIGGPGVARGYRNRPELTAERFLVDPCDGGRMYCTGDQVTLLDDGTLRYCRRVDDQVKVRGFRIELSAIDTVAESLPGVRAAAAFVVGGDRIGLAVVPAVAAEPVPETDVRPALRAALPAHMVPSVVVHRAALPTTTTGKVDRDALARDVTAGEPAPDASAARLVLSSDTEREVAAAWSDVGVDVPDVDADFFASGGHSLVAARAVTSLRRRTGMPLTLQHLLANPTVAGLARALDEMRTVS